MLEYDMDELDVDAWPNFKKEGDALDPARESMMIDDLVEFEIVIPQAQRELRTTRLGIQRIEMPRLLSRRSFA